VWPSIDAAGYWLEESRRMLQWINRGFAPPDRDPRFVTPYGVIYEGGKVSLRHYEAAARRFRTPVMLVYALIKRPFVLDLQPGISVVDNLTRQGFEVFLVDWIPPRAADAWRGFDAYLNQDMANAMRAVRIHQGVEQVSIIGYCLGALMGLVYTSLHPKDVKNLVTVGLPLDTSVRALPLYQFIDWLDEGTVDLIADTYGNCPAWLLNGFFSTLASGYHMLSSDLGLYPESERERYAREIPGFARWLDSEVALAGRLFRELVKDIFKKNLLFRGTFTVAGEAVNLKRVTCPVLNVVGSLDAVVHPRSSLPLTGVVGSDDKTNLTFPTGHLGMAVSREAHAELWPRIGEWLKQHDDLMTLREARSRSVWPPARLNATGPCATRERRERNEEQQTRDKFPQESRRQKDGREGEYAETVRSFP
jgi:polyhydroxyalkanoate synthase